MTDMKVIGFRVGKRRPTFNKTIENYHDYDFQYLGKVLFTAISRSDFLSIRKVQSLADKRALAEKEEAKP